MTPDIDPRFNPAIPLPVDQRQCAAWPREVLVPLRSVRGPRFAPVGVEEGDLCMRSYPDGRPPCLGKMVLRRDPDQGGCYCWRSAPCGSCLSEVPECDTCGHREPEA